MGFTSHHDDFVFRSDAMVLHQRAAEASVGIAVLQTWMGDQTGLVRLLPEVTMLGHPIHLTAHPELHRNPRVYKVWRHLGDARSQAFNTSEGQP